MEPKYHRVLLKLSGEALAGPKKTGLDTATMLPICKSIQKCVNAGVQMGIVVGGGNFWRGRSSENMDRTRADHIACGCLPSGRLSLCAGAGRHRAFVGRAGIAGIGSSRADCN